MAIQLESNRKGSVHLRLFRNRAFVLLWSGQTVSTLGDTFFNLAVMWVIYAQSGSTLQTAVVQVIWHLDRIIFGSIAGIFADRWDRKGIMVVTNILSAAVVGAVVAVMFARGQAPSAIIFVAVFLINSLNTFLSPARVSIMPEVVGRDLLATASGWFSSAGQVASLIGSALAGVVIATVGAAWAVMIDAFSFMGAALAIAMAPLPGRTILPSSSSPSEEQLSALRLFLHEMRDGWGAIADLPVVRALVWLGMLINVASFMGPLYPALVRQRLQGDAAAYGTINAASVIGVMVGGALAGTLERRLGAGRLLAASWGLSGVCVLGIATSIWLPLTTALEAAQAFGVTVGSVVMGALVSVRLPENYRGRVWGIMASVSAVSIPLSTLVGGWLADMVGVAPLFAGGGAWILGSAALAWSNRHVRTAHI